MTDQSPNDQFHASSFMQGHNAEYIEQLYARYADNPNAVDESWQAFFKSLGDAPADAKAEAAGPSWGRHDWPPIPNDDLTAALDGQWAAEPEAAGKKIKEKAAASGANISEEQVRHAVLDSIRALMIIRAYRIRVRTRNLIRRLTVSPPLIWIARSLSTTCSALKWPP